MCAIFIFFCYLRLVDHNTTHDYLEKDISFLTNKINEKQCCKLFIYLLMHNSHNIYKIIMFDKYFQFCLGFGFMVQENEFENMLS